jgi:hypothetical protein
MDIKVVGRNGIRIAVVYCDTPAIADGQAALDFVANVGWEHNCRDIAVSKSAFVADFFRLSSGVAGEVTQKFVNYGFRVAVFGDFSEYKSKSLRDYMYECNNGNHLYFVETEAAALEKLSDIG